MKLLIILKRYWISSIIPGCKRWRAAFVMAFGVCFFCHTGWSQSLDTIPPDSQEEVVVHEDVLPRSNDEWAPDPKKALWMSLAVPGLGQIYNKSWWKTPLIYGGLGTSIWFIKTNNQHYKDFKRAYSDSFDPSTDNELVEMYPNQETLRRIRDIYYKRYQLSIIATAAVYLMNGIEAYVDAHLKNFDVSEDLSLMLGKPAVSSDPVAPYFLSHQTSAGYTLIGIRYRLH